MPFYYVDFELAIQSYPLKHGLYKHRKGPPLCTKVVGQMSVQVHPMGVRLTSRS